MPAAALLVPIWLLGGVANGGRQRLHNLLLARRVPEAARGRAFAVFGAAVQGAGMAGYLVGGLLLELAEPRPLVAGSGVAGLLVVAAVVARSAGRSAPSGRPGRRTRPRRPARCGVGHSGAVPLSRRSDGGDTVGAWLTASPAPGSDTSSS